MINNYDDLISRYIEDDLNKDETASFEKYMNSNKEFSKKVNDIKNNISFCQNLPKKDTSKDFLTNRATAGEALSELPETIKSKCFLWRFLTKSSKTK